MANIAQTICFNALCEEIGYPEDQRENLRQAATVKGNPLAALNHFIAAIEKGRGEMGKAYGERGDPVVSVAAIDQYYKWKHLDPTQWDATNWRAAGRYLSAPFAEIQETYHLEPPPRAPKENPFIAMRALADNIQYYADNPEGLPFGEVPASKKPEIRKIVRAKVTTALKDFERALERPARPNTDDTFSFTELLLKYLGTNFDEIANIEPKTTSKEYWKTHLRENPQALNKQPPAQIGSPLPANTLSQVLAQRIVTALFVKETRTEQERKAIKRVAEKRWRNELHEKGR